MQRFITLVLLIFISTAIGWGRPVCDEEESRDSLSVQIEEYFGALQMTGESMEVQMAEADFMIGISGDSLIRQDVAGKIYDFYVSSPVMGAENVAVYIFDKWFKDGGIKMDSDTDFLNARIFAEFNRQSLLGAKAPSLAMQTFDGTILSFDGTSRGRYSILYFYDTSCSKCRVESILLRNMIETEDFPVDYYAIYAGDDHEAWGKYIEEKLAVSNDKTGFIHLWDPAIDSDYQRKYGVIQTPRLFLVGPDGLILGRGLDTKALTLMLHQIFDPVKLEYGGKEAMELFDSIFSEGASSVEEVTGIADYIEDSTLPKGDTVMFRQLTGDMLYYISSRREEAFKEGCAYLIDNKILSRGDIWTGQDDSLKVVGMAEFWDSLLDKAKPGTVVPSLKLPGIRLHSSKARSGEYRLDKLRGRRNIVIFYTDGCNICDAEKEAARQLAAADRKLRVLFVNVDEVMSSSQQLAESLIESFDLSSLPFILETDKKGKVLRRYITLQ